MTDSSIFESYSINVRDDVIQTFLWRRLDESQPRAAMDIYTSADFVEVRSLFESLKPEMVDYYDNKCIKVDSWERALQRAITAMSDARMDTSVPLSTFIDDLDTRILRIGWENLFRYRQRRFELSGKDNENTAIDRATFHMMENFSQELLENAEPQEFLRLSAKKGRSINLAGSRSLFSPLMPDDFKRRADERFSAEFESMLETFPVKV